MTTKLARLDDLKAQLGTTETAQDALLSSLLERATAQAEGANLAGRPLRRREGVVDLPHSYLGASRYVRLTLAPIESVASVKQLYSVGTDADFDAADPLAENRDYVVDYAMGKIVRVGSVWYTQRRMLQVIYTGGYIDPDIAGLGEITSGVLPPEDLQQGIIEQAVLLWTQRGLGGNDRVDLASGGGQTLSRSKIHPALQEACRSLRRVLV